MNKTDNSSYTGQKIRIKDIAELAGVSAGTVDRVLHGRGNVSPASRTAVEKVLATVGYKPNLYLSSISLKRKYRIAITTPRYEEGEYWGQIRQGMLRAIEEYDQLDIECIFMCYDQFDLYSCRATFEEVVKAEPDAVIVGPTFKDETIVLANRLDDKNIPYVYVDSTVYDSSPVAFFSADQNMCGYMLAKLIHQITPPNAEYAICQAIRRGDESAHNTLLRKSGFMEFFNERGLADRVRRVSFSVVSPEENAGAIGDFFARNPRVKGAVVLSSRGNVIADYLKTNGIKDVRLACLDLTGANMAALGEGSIDFVLGQRPAQQGFLAVKAMMMNLIFGRHMRTENYMPLDIITRENARYYREFADTEPGVYMHDNENRDNK